MRDWIVGRWHNLGYAVDSDDRLTVAILAPQSECRFTIDLCPQKMRAHRYLPPPPPAATPVPDPTILSLCGLALPAGRFHVFLFDEGRPCAT